MRDDSADGDRATAELNIRQRHMKNLEVLQKQGLDATVLAVAPHVPKTTRVMVASPSQEEKRLKAAGTSAGAIFFSVGAKPFNGPLITKIALERKEEKDASEALKNNVAKNAFDSLRSKVQKLMTQKEEEEVGFADFTQNERHNIIAYVLKAKGETGITKHAASAEAAIAFLEALPAGVIATLLANPPCLKGDGRIGKGVAGPPCLALPAPPPLLMPPVTFASGFEEVHSLELEALWGLKVIEAPPWLEAALVVGSETALVLVDWYILFKWPARSGGWAMGQVSCVAEDSEEVGGEKCNYSIYYAGDDASAQHRLGMTMYAKDAKSPTESWVLLEKIVGP